MLCDKLGLISMLGLFVSSEECKKCTCNGYTCKNVMVKQRLYLDVTDIKIQWLDLD